LKIKKDYDILYTNRAQVYVKQGRYEDAINDCDWALKVKKVLHEINVVIVV
jgi:tetratricopeptide (TPR) repeat protein